MDVQIRNLALRGLVEAPPSKSDAHRAMICAALGDAPTTIQLGGSNEDMDATASCLIALGAKIERTDDAVIVHPIGARKTNPVLDCKESGSTLRFLIPVAAAVSEGARFMGQGRLPERPVDELLSAMAQNGCTCDAERLPFSLGGGLRAGIYTLPGDVSSQFISGLLMALPLLPGDSRLVVSTKLESPQYVDMTLKTLGRFGVAITTHEGGYTIPGNQIYRSPSHYQVEGDWSGAAAFFVANALGGRVTVAGLSETSVQPDRAVAGLMENFPQRIDVSAFPDLFPLLAVRACVENRDTLLHNARRLRLKESDRIAQTARLIQDLGGEALEFPEALLIRGGGSLRGGVVSSAGDHRIAMAGAIAAAICQEPVTVTDAQAVSKSYPAFWEVVNGLSKNEN